MDNTKTEYFSTESYHICRSSLYRDEHKSFILYKARERGFEEEYKGWYLRAFESKDSPNCYEYYKVIKSILNGRIEGINQEIDKIMVVLEEDFVLNRQMTRDWSDEQILEELSKCFWKE